MSRSLLCTVGTGIFAIPLEHVVETMRPLPVAPVAGTPSFVRGVAIVRGEPLPVIDGARLVADQESGEIARFVTLRVGARRVVLAVQRIIGIRDIEDTVVRELPPLLRGAGTEAMKLGALDAQLLVVLDATRAVPESVLIAALEEELAL